MDGEFSGIRFMWGRERDMSRPVPVLSLASHHVLLNFNCALFGVEHYWLL